MFMSIATSLDIMHTGRSRELLSLLVQLTFVVIWLERKEGREEALADISTSTAASPTELHQRDLCNTS